MYTGKKLKDVTGMIKDGYPFSNEIMLLADKVRASWQMWGYTHMLKEFSKADDTLLELIMNCLNHISKGDRDATSSTAGVIVNIVVDEENLLVLTVSFRLN